MENKQITVENKAAINKKEPFLRVVKRGNISFAKKLCLTLISVVVALLVGAIFLSATGVPAFKFYAEIVRVCFAAQINLKMFVGGIFPLILTTLGISFAFKMKFWNIGAQGQFLIGALMSTIVGLFLSDSLPRWLLIIFMVVAGIVGGGIFGLITAFFKVQFGTNETLLTLMFNYIAIYIIKYLRQVEGFYEQSGWVGSIQKLPIVARLTEFGIFDASLIVCIVMVIVSIIYFKYTKQGYEINIVGDSINTAKYAGINTKKVILRTMFISSAIVGLAGMLYTSGSTAGYQLTTEVGQFGWTGIIVAWLAKLNPFGIVIVSVLMTILTKGSFIAKTTFNVSESVADILQGIILFTVLAFDFFISYKIVMKDNKFKSSVITPVTLFFDKIDNLITDTATKISNSFYATIKKAFAKKGGK